MNFHIATEIHVSVLKWTSSKSRDGSAIYFKVKDYLSDNMELDLWQFMDKLRNNQIWTI